MPLLRGLSRDEADALIHKIRNSGRRLGDYNGDILNEMINKNVEKKLAKVSEEERFLAKNRYRLQKTKLDFADKKRMPIDESKLKDVLRNRPSFRQKIEEEIGNYDYYRFNPQFEYGVLTYLNEASMGEMRDLVRDIGIHTDNMEFFNVGDLQKQREKSLISQGDSSFNYLMNALFTPLDMTDYEDTFVGYNELNAGLPISNVQLLKPVLEDTWPASHALAAMETPEARPKFARSRLHRELLETKAAEEEAEGEEEEEEEGEEEEGEEGEEGEGEEGEGEAEEEAAEEVEEDVWPPKERVPSAKTEDRYFLHGENLRNKFNEVELDSFMKLLNVKPFKQW